MNNVVLVPNEFSPILIGRVGSGAIQSIADRPKATKPNPFSKFGNKDTCTHYDLVAEVEGAEARQVFCRNRRAIGAPNGFLCRDHQERVFPRKSGIKVRHSSVEADICHFEDRALSRIKRGRVRLITAGPNSKYLEFVL